MSSGLKPLTPRSQGEKESENLDEEVSHPGPELPSINQRLHRNTSEHTGASHVARHKEVVSNGEALLT